MNAFGSPEMLETLSTAWAGSISSWTSLKRTDWVVSAMMDEEVRGLALGCKSATLRHDEGRAVLDRVAYIARDR